MTGFPYIPGFPSPPQPPKRKVFISFFQADRPEVDNFIFLWSVLDQNFIARALGVSIRLKGTRNHQFYGNQRFSASSAESR